MERTRVLSFAAGLIFSFVVGVLIGVYGPSRDMKKENTSPDVTQMLMEEIRAENIDKNLRFLTQVPHLAGTPQDFEIASWVRDQFVKSNLDDVQLKPYQVLLSFPDKNRPNKVHLVDSDGIAVFSTSGRQAQLWSPEEASPSVQPTFNAYSATGTVQGELVYANYGRKEDFVYLKERGIDVRGKLVIARYGKIFRGNIVQFAQEAGAIGVILFSDPKDFAPEGRASVYPNSSRMPGSGVQSGSTYMSYGDPLTPFYPSIESAFRIPEAEAPLPRIPVQPISYDEAEVILKAMSPINPAPDDWQGGLDTLYSLGPELKSSNWTVKLEVWTNNQLATTYNVIGMIRGREEPDRYVMIGNHLDAWIFGAADPSSGTAVLLEITRAFGHLKATKGWRPRRTLLFCGWGAEEYAMLGSYEWAEEYAKVLSQRAVAYLNVDTAIEGNYTLRSGAMPTMHTVVREAAKLVPNPDPSEVAAGRPTVYDTWLHTSRDPLDTHLPHVGHLGSGSDFTVFANVLGIACIDVFYGYKEKIGSYPLYHTLYETYHLVAHLVDRGFLFQRAVAQVLAETARNLSESTILPIDIRNYATFLDRDLTKLEKRYSDLLSFNNATFDHFRSAVNQFMKAVDYFMEQIVPRVDTNDPLAVRIINDQLMQVERAFIEPRGLPNRKEFNHVVIAPSSVDKYSSDSFAGLLDLLKSVGNRTEDEESALWRQIKEHLAVLAYLIRGAAHSLRDNL